MTGGTVFIRGTFMSCVVRSYLSCRMKQMASWLRLLPHIRHLRVGDSTERTATGVSYASLVTASRRHTHSPTSQHRNRQQPSARHSSTGGGWGGDDRNRFPVKLMDFPEITMPDFVKSFRNKFFAFLIKGYYDSTFTVDGFVEKPHNDRDIARNMYCFFSSQVDFALPGWPCKCNSHGSRQISLSDSWWPRFGCELIFISYS